MASDPAEIGSVTAANSANAGGKDGDFAAALNQAGAKPTRKLTGHGSDGSVADGGQLPVTGNSSPPAAMAAAAASAPPAAAAAGRAGRSLSNDDAGSTTAIGTAGSGPAAASAAVAPTELPAAATDVQRVAGIAAGFSLSPGQPAGADGIVAQNPQVGALAGTASAAPPPAGATPDLRTVQTTPLVQELASPKGGAAAGRAVGGASGRAIQTATATAATAAKEAATSAPSAAADGTANSANPGAGTATAPGTDLTAQAASAAAVAAATGIVADNSATTDSTLSPVTVVITPATGSAKGAAVAKGAAAANGSPAPGSAIAADRSAAAAQASTAAVLGSGGGLGADKHAGSDRGSSLLSDAAAGTAGAAQLSLNSTSNSAAVAAPTLRVTAGVDTPEFGHGIAERVSWMVDSNLSSAKLQINPPQLGPIEVRISVQGDHAQVWLTSHSAVTRDALESSSPKLREMLGAQGFGQVSVDISQRNFQDRSAYAQPYEWTPEASVSSSATLATAAVSLPRLSSGAVDAYA